MNRQPTLVRRGRFGTPKGTTRQESMLGMRIRIGPNLSFGASCGPIEALRGDFDGDEINLHLPQGAHVVSELQNLLSVRDQIVTGQSGAPVVRLIQDSVAVAFWLTHIQPETQCPQVLPRHIWEQIVCDLDIDTHVRIREIRRLWDECIPPDHPSKRALTAAGIDYMRTGWAVLSLCLPAGCTFHGRQPATSRLVALYRQARCLPPAVVPLCVERGLYLGGIVTSDTLTGSKGLLNHIYQNHGPSMGMSFLSHLQRMTTSVSLYSYCPSVGIDDCLLPSDIVVAAQGLIATEVQRYISTPNVCPGEDAVPYRLDGNSSAEGEVGQLVQLRGPSEHFVTRYVLGQKHSHRSVPTHWSATSPARLNQIALLAMLATKGSVSNLIQCSHSLGQQIVADARLPVSDYDRVFPHDDPYPENQQQMESQGLLWRESFIAGLSPLAFFVHAIAGREALVEGATSTAQSGYSMRLGVKAMESTVTEYDHTTGTPPAMGGVPSQVRDSGRIIQFRYRNGWFLTKNHASTMGQDSILVFRPQLVTSVRLRISRPRWVSGVTSTTLDNKSAKKKEPMSINIALTISPITDRGGMFFFHASRRALGFGDMDTESPLDSLSALFLPSGLFSNLPPLPMPPQPISTADFNVNRGRYRKRTRRRSQCCICLEDIQHNNLRLPCNHEFHALCAFSLLCPTVFGSNSMLSCPLCRHPIDRHHLSVMGIDVSPRRLKVSANRCEALRILSSGCIPMMSAIRQTQGILLRKPPDTEQPLLLTRKMLQICRRVAADDGFAYNVCVFPIERALYHRRIFHRTMEAQLRVHPPDDVLGFIKTSLACHIEVLIKTRREQETM